MNERIANTRSHRLCLLAALGGAAGALVTGAACIGPLLGIALGIGGLGWLSRYSFLQIPATLISLALLVAGFVLLYRRQCPAVRATRTAKLALWAAALIAFAINGFEYLILPSLG